MKHTEPLNSNHATSIINVLPQVNRQYAKSFQKQIYLFWKRCFDIVCILVAVPILLPAIFFIGALIWLNDHKNPFFIQMRTGKYGRRFAMYKFRTMVPNAEELKQELQHLNVLEYPDFKIPDDPRITKIGRFLRRTSLDELPQTLNILLGDMSIVGPRPTSFKPETYEPWHYERLKATPGLTGLWQVSGRSDLEFDDRVKLDIEYIENQNLFFDLKIIFQTATSMFTGRGAY